VALAPDNPDYRRDLSVSYERLADLARAAGNTGEAEGWIDKALEIRRDLSAIESSEGGFRREFAVVLYLSVVIDPERTQDARAEAETLLAPFEQAERLTPRAAKLLEWDEAEPPGQSSASV
jgi:hypothetical protein